MSHNEAKLQGPWPAAVPEFKTTQQTYFTDNTIPLREKFFSDNSKVLFGDTVPIVVDSSLWGVSIR